MSRPKPRLAPAFRDFEAWQLRRNLRLCERLLANPRAKTVKGRRLPPSELEALKAWREQALLRLAQLRRRGALGRWPKG